MHRNDRILITGGTGFIGARLAQVLANRARTALVERRLALSGMRDGLRWLPDRLT